MKGRGRCFPPPSTPLPPPLGKEKGREGTPELERTGSLCWGFIKQTMTDNIEPEVLV
jgi:hypothetical protein